MDRVGYYMPFALVSLVFTAVGTGLISTFRVDTTTDRWVGYQILLGFGSGLGIQMVSTTWAVEVVLVVLAETDQGNDAITADSRNPKCSWV